MAPGVKRSSTADRVAQVLRDEITKGKLPPGRRLAEKSLGESLGVARNTLREAFRVLSQEGLVVHLLNRGVFVRELTVEGIADVYHLRRAIEIEAAMTIEERAEPELDLEPLRRAIEEADKAALAGDLVAVGTADLVFHASIVALAGSARLSEVMDRLEAEIRLAFGMSADIEQMNVRYILRNKMLLGLLEAGDLKGFSTALRAYLTDSMADILRTYAMDGAVLDR